MATVTALSRTVPAAVPGIVFLSGTVVVQIKPVTNKQVCNPNLYGCVLFYVHIFVFSKESFVVAAGAREKMFRQGAFPFPELQIYVGDLHSFILISFCYSVPRFSYAMSFEAEGKGVVLAMGCLGPSFGRKSLGFKSLPVHTDG